MSDESTEHQRLEETVARLEDLILELRDAGDDPERLDMLATEALDLSSRIGDSLPRVIREIEDAAQAGPVVARDEETEEGEPAADA